MTNAEIKSTADEMLRRARKSEPRLRWAILDNNARSRGYWQGRMESLREAGLYLTGKAAKEPGR